MPSIIIYFSRAGENYVGGSIQRLETGNTEIAARLLQQETQGEIFRLEPKTPYSDLYRECVAQAREEMQRDARPALAAYPQSMEKYDTVYLAYPIIVARCPCRSLHFWNTMILRARRSVRFAPTRAVGWDTARRISGGCAGGYSKGGPCGARRPGGAGWAGHSRLDNVPAVTGQSIKFRLTWSVLQEVY